MDGRTGRRRRIAYRLAAIWLVAAVPLALVLLVTFRQWYAERVTAIEQQRLGYARLSANSFGLLVDGMDEAMRAAGTGLVGAPSSLTKAFTLRQLVLRFPVAYAALAGMDGKIAAASAPGVVGSSVATDPAFQQALHHPSGAGIEPSAQHGLGVVGFHVAVPVRTSNGRTAGVMLMLVDVRRLHDTFPVAVPQGGISVIDSAGQVVFQNEDERLAERRAYWGRFPFVMTALEGQPATTLDFPFPLGGRRMAAFVPVIELRGWAAGSSVDSVQALSPFYGTLLVAAPVALAFIAAALALSASLSGGIGRSLRMLASDARRIGRGQLAQAVRTERADEIGEVAASLEAARTQLLAARQRSERQLETTQRLLDVNRSLAEWTRLDALLAGLAEALLESTPHDRASVFLWDQRERTLTCLASAGVDTFPLGQAFHLDQLCEPTQRLLRSGATVLVDYDALPPAECGNTLLSADSHLALEVPLSYQNSVFGMIGVDDAGTRREFTPQDVELIRGAASEAAVAIEQARLFEAEHAIAEALQTSMLVMPERLHGVDFAHSYHSATEAARVGGDFYDLFELDDGRIGVTMGDVAGKGLEAAVLTAVSKNTIKAYASEAGRTAKAVLDLTNQLLWRVTPVEAFVTAFFAIIDTRDGRVRYANGGHTTAGVIRRDRSVERLASTGPLLGAIPGVEIGEGEVRLAEGDVLFLYTDGVTEARRGRELYGEERLFAHLGALAGEDTGQVVEQVFQEVVDFTGNLLRDDLAILALSWRPDAARAASTPPSS